MKKRYNNQGYPINDIQNSGSGMGSILSCCIGPNSARERVRKEQEVVITIRRSR